MQYPDKDLYSLNVLIFSSLMCLATIVLSFRSLILNCIVSVIGEEKGRLVPSLDAATFMMCQNVGCQE